MKLENIGFYTLSDERAGNTNPNSRLERCELIITDRCNFRCPYCRGLKSNLRGDISSTQFHKTLCYWTNNGLRNIRLSGGEPTLHPYLTHMVDMCKRNNVKRIAISTNGSADIELYKQLIRVGLNDISISLDACCSSTGDTMIGKTGYFNKVIENIRVLSKMTYVTVGVVLTEKNIMEAQKTIEFADGLGVADIRIIPSAQYSKSLGNIKINPIILKRHPILKYRLSGERVRGIQKTDCNRCGLVFDDMAVARGYHFPCIIYMREGGEPIGKFSGNIRKQREEWYRKHDTHRDNICRNNCLDVCVDYNNKVAIVSK